MKAFKHSLIMIFFCVLVVSCGEPDNSSGKTGKNAQALSLLDRLDQGVGPINLDVVVMPFTDRNGQVYLLSADGKIDRVKGAEASADEPVAVPGLNKAKQWAIEKTLEADLHLVGVLGRQGRDIVLLAAALDPWTGKVYASYEDKIVVTAELLETLSLPEGLPDQALSLTSSSFLQIYEKNGFRKQNLKFKVPRLASGPKGGWGGVFRRALGLGDKGKTQTRPIVWKPWGLDTRPNDGDDPRDTPPPEIFGEEIDTEMVCRVKLQCRWATARMYYPPISPIISVRNKHCGYYTYIPGASIERLGTHVQPGVAGGTHGGSLLNGHVQALVFKSDRGFQELSWAYKFLPYDNVRDSRNTPPVCAMAKCIRENSWKYHLLDARPYTPFGSDKPNSNSFIGAMKTVCNVPADNLPTYVRGGGDQEGNYAGLHYWDRVGHRWATSKM